MIRYWNAVRTSLPFAVSAWIAACSDPTQLVTAPAEPDGAAGSGGDASVSDGAADASLDAITLPDSSTPDSIGFDACAQGTVPVELLPLDIVILLDKSGSMYGARWTAVSGALKDFVALPQAQDLGVGLQYFPLSGSGVCSFQAYSQIPVPVAPLSSNAGAIQASLDKIQNTNSPVVPDDQKPSGETPTLPALQGVMSYAQTWAGANPDHTVIVLLATDGDPNVCGSTVANVANVAMVARTATPSIRTFVIGVGSSLGSLNAIADAGGSGEAYLVDDSSQPASAVQANFIKALNDIRGKALSCEMVIPVPDAGKLDPLLVNVVYRSGASEQVVPHVTDAAACEATPFAWYYDDASHPTRVILCPGACESIRSDSEGQVELLFGCGTIIA